jgi:hypothetical protein
MTFLLVVMCLSLVFFAVALPIADRLLDLLWDWMRNKLDQWLPRG